MKKNKGKILNRQLLKSAWNLNRACLKASHFRCAVPLLTLILITLLITACASMTIAEVEWNTLEGPEKARQFMSISNSEVKVFAVYKNGDRRQISAGTLRYDRNTAGPQTVIVSVSGVAGGSFQIEVMELTSIRVEQLPLKTAYTAGERASLSGIRVMGTWADMPDAEIPFSQLRVADFDSSIEGNADIIVSYNGMNTSFPVTVTARSAAPTSAAASGSYSGASSTTGQSDDPEWQLILDRVNLLVDNHFENRNFSEARNANWNITGLSVGIYKNGRTAFFNRGYHESEQRRVANRRLVTENSIFPIGSVSKPISTIMLSYFSRINNPRTGRPYVNLNDPVNNYFPTKPYIDTDGTQVHPTLLQFVTHYGGIAIGGGSYTLAQFRSLLENLTYVHKPGTAYQYSSGSTVAANIVASQYYNDYPQRRVNDLLTEFLFSPLGMNSTKLHGWIDPALQDRMTLPHRFNGAPGSFRSVPTTGINLGGPSGCITSTAVDMMRLAAFILGDNVPQGSEILQQAAAAGLGWRSGNRSVPSTALTPLESNIEKLGGRFRELFTRPSNSGQRYGRILRHGGAIGTGHNTSMIMCPDTKTAVVVLINTQSSLPGTLAAHIMGRVLNATYPAVVQRNPFDDQIASYARANANMDIVLNEDFTIELPVNHIRAPAMAGATLTIRSANPARPVTLTRGTSGDLFIVPNGATLIFKDIIIDGGGSVLFLEVDDDDDDDDDEEGEAVNESYTDEDGNQVQLTRPAAVVAGSLVRVNSDGTFIMESGAVLRNNINSGDGGGVYIARGGTFTMNGGEISGNTAQSSGGVMLRDGVFIMNGGKITGNTALGVGGGVRNPYANGVFTMNGGEISGNSGTIGGGVRLSGRAVFTMTGGRISGNTATNDGGGVAITNTGTVFNLNGGEISGNTGRDGGGIRLSGGTFTMRNGRINGNTANLGGGGVSVSGSASEFNINGGSISGNTSTNAGGGIAVWSSAVINMSGGEIIGNNAPSGNGVRRASGTFNLNGGVIAGTGANIAAIMSGTYNLNTASPNNAVIIAWNRPVGTSSGTLNYTVGSSTNLTVSAGGTATWANQSGVLGISYTNGANRGWIRLW